MQAHAPFYRPYYTMAGAPGTRHSAPDCAKVPPGTSFALSATSAGTTDISAHEGTNPLFTAFLAEATFDQAQQ